MTTLLDDNGNQPQPSPPPSGDNQFKTGDIDAESAFFGNIGAVYQFGQSNATTFSAKRAWSMSAAHEHEISELFVGESLVIGSLLHQLEQNRVLLLTGDRGAGKTTAALYLSTQLRIQKKAHEKTLVFDALERQMRIDIRKVAEQRMTFGERTVVFSNALTHRNRDLSAFFSRVDKIGFDQLTHTLRQNDAYLIFTASPDEVVPFRQNVAQHLAIHHLPPLSGNLATEAFDRKVKWLSDKGSSAAHLEALQKRRDNIVATLKTVPMVAAFVSDFLRGDTDVDLALKRFKDIPFWFQNALASDVDAWCFALALTLAHATRDANSVSWMDFDRLRRIVTERVKVDPELFPRRKRVEQQPEDAPDRTSSAESLCDEPLLARSRAKVTKDAARLGDVVMFEEPSYPADIWDTLLNQNRRVLTMLLPSLRTLAEDGGAANFSLRVLAAQMIGRIGEIAPHSITTPIVAYEWLTKDDRRQRPLIGRLMQGVLASRNENYRQAGLRMIDALTNTEAAESNEDPNDRLLTAISAYAQIGEYEPMIALERLGAIAIERLAPAVDNLHQVVRLRETLDQQLSEVSSKRMADRIRSRRARVARLAAALSEEHGPTLLAINRAVVHLCLTRDPVQILREMRNWISKGGAPAGVLVGLLFLHEGIADSLELFADEISRISGSVVPSPILMSLADSDTAVDHLCGFLADIHGSLNSTFTLPADVQRYFRDRFTTCLTTWARGAVLNPLFQSGLEELFVALAAARGGVMRGEIYALIGTPAFAESDALKKFATNVRKQIGS